MLFRRNFISGPKMKLTLVSGVLFGIQLIVCDSYRITKYAIPTNNSLGVKTMRCASKSTELSNIAARFNVESGDCKGETLEPSENNETLDGYITMRKTIVREVYNPPLLENGLKFYKLPVDPRDECEIEIVFTMVHPLWDALTFILADTLDETVPTDLAPEVDIPARVIFNRDLGILRVRSNTNGTWTGFGNVDFTVTLDVQYKLTIKLLLTKIKLLVDDVELMYVTPTTAPSDSKLLGIRQMQHIMLHSITFKEI